MDYTFSQAEIRNLWSQIVQEKGVDCFTPEEWQEIYEDFCSCLLSDLEPFTRIDKLEQLQQGIVRTQPVYSNQLTSFKSLAKVREETPRNFVVQPPPLVDKFNEEWRQPIAKKNQQLKRMQSVPFKRQNNPQHQFAEQPQQWNRPHSQSVVQTQQQRQQQQWKSVVQQNQQQQQQQQQQPHRPLNHEFRIPRVPQQQQQQQLNAQTPRINAESPYFRSQPPVPNMKPFGEAIPLQELYEQSRMRKPLSVPNINADVSKINTQQIKEDISAPKMQKLELKDQFSLQELYEKNRIRQPLSVPNINADITRINSKPKTETNSVITENTLSIANAMKAIVGGGNAEIGQQIPTVDGNKKVESFDDWLQDFPDKTSIELDHDIGDTADFFNNLPNPAMVIGKTSQDLIAVLNNMPKGGKVSKKSKKKRNKNKTK